ncbi:MAG TPA: VWA domain-containing protein [Vicinamibacteria bacterium]
MSTALMAVLALRASSAEREPAARSLPRFGARAEIVNVSVSVSDVRGQVVPDLRPEDFRVVEDGVPQDVVVFTEQRVPLSIALLVDASGSMTPALPAVKAAATRLARALGAEDEAALVLFNDRSLVLQDFTADKGRLDAAIGQLSAAGPTALYSAVYVMLKDPHLQADPERMRRRAIVVLTDGEDTSSLVTDDQTLQLARQRDATIYAISLRATRVDDAQRAPLIHQATYFLNALARDTGGRAYFPARLADLDGVYDRIAGELRSQYVIGYVSSSAAPQGRWRQISVQSRRANILLHHRPGYYATPAPPGPRPTAANAAGR